METFRIFLAGASAMCFFILAVLAIQDGDKVASGVFAGLALSITTLTFV